MSFLKFAFSEAGSLLKVKWFRLSHKKGRQGGKIMDYTACATFNMAHTKILISFLFCVFDENLLHYYAGMISNACLFSCFCFLSDEEEVGPWPRGPIFPFRQKALQRPRISKVRQTQISPKKSLPVAQQRHPSLLHLFLKILTAQP